MKKVTTRTIIVNSQKEARREIDRLFPTDYEKDEVSSARAGYGIYRHHTLNPNVYFSDLGTGYELTNVEGEGSSIRIRIEERKMKSSESI